MIPISRFPSFVKTFISVFNLGRARSARNPAGPVESASMARAALMATLVAATVAASGVTSPAAAMPITFTYEAELTSVDSELSSFFSIGDSLRLTYTFESTTPDTDPSSDPNIGLYRAITGLSLTVGTFSWSALAGDILVANDVGGDFYFISVLSGRDALSGDILPGPIGISEVSLDLRDFFAGTGGPFTSDALPTTAPDPSLFGGPNFIHIEFADSDQNELDLTALNPTLVPEPPTTALLVIGLAALAFLAWRPSRAA